MAIVGDSPVCEKFFKVKSSRSGHVKSWLNMGGPSSKAKYSQLTDSEPVPWGKGEKNPGEGSEIEPETVYVQAVGAPSLSFFEVWCDSLLLLMVGTLTTTREAAVGKPNQSSSGCVEQQLNSNRLRSKRWLSDGVTAYLLYNGSATYI